VKVHRLHRSPFKLPWFGRDHRGAKSMPNTAPKTEHVIAFAPIIDPNSNTLVRISRVAREIQTLSASTLSIRANLTADAVHTSNVRNDYVCACGRTWFQVAGKCRSGADQRAPGKKSAFDFHIGDTL
jgi:hypothetical protein